MAFGFDKLMDPEYRMDPFSEYYVDQSDDHAPWPSPQMMRILAAKRMRDGQLGGGYGGTPRALVLPVTQLPCRQMDPRVRASLLARQRSPTGEV